jgi:glycosyltransferase involved in cell wall biosynthesis
MSTGGRALSFSVVIVTKGRPAPLRCAIESVARELQSDGELLVVDGDPERSAEAPVRALEDGFAELHIRYIATQPGMTLQRNAGIDAAQGDVVLFVDDDCTLEPGIFEVLACAYSDTEVVGVTGRVERRARGRIGPESHSRLRWLLLGAGRQGTMNSSGLRRPIVNVAKARDVEYMFGAFMSARRYVAASVRFDEALTGYCLGEDDDFSYRLSRRGRIRYEPAAAVFHDELGYRATERAEVDRARVVNRAYLFRKNFTQTLRARVGFMGLMAMLCTHRILNRDWSGLRGLLAGMGDVRRAGGLRAPSLRPAGARLQPVGSLRLAATMRLALILAVAALGTIGIDELLEAW